MFYVQIRRLLHQIKFVVDRVLEVKLNFSKEQQQFFYVLPNLMIFPIPSIHPTESITYFRLIEIKFWKSVFKIVINSGNSKVSNFYTQQHCILLILYIYILSKTYINWWLIFQKRSYFFLLSLKGNRTPEEFAQSIPYVEVAQTEALGNCGDWKSQERDGRSRTRHSL